MECIVLAGGLGTRLQGVIGAMPKCMALVAGQPFLYYVFQYLSAQGCKRVILSLGFKHEMVTDWLRSRHWAFEIDYVIESEPLGTGGGIQLALSRTHNGNVVVLNGDTMFRADLSGMLAFHLENQAQTTIALKELENFDRYGVVTLNDQNAIVSFQEKRAYEKGLINGGVYIVQKTALLQRQLPDKYSFEKEYLEAFVEEGHFYGYLSPSYFIDIGIPEDFARAQSDFAEV